MKLLKNCAVSAGKMCFLLALVTALAATTPIFAKNTQIEELIRVSGGSTTFDTFPESVKAGLQTIPAGEVNREKFIAAASSAADTAFAPKLLVEKLIVEMDGKLPPADAEAMIAFYKSPLGVRMVTFEQQLNAPDIDKKIAAAAPDLAKSFSSEPDRAKAITQIIDSLKLIDKATTIALAMNRATALGMAAGAEGGNTLSVDEIDQKVEESRAATNGQMAQIMPLFLAYAYRDATVKDLTDYHAALTTPSGSKFNEALANALTQVLVDGGLVFGELIMKDMKAERL